MSLGMEPIVVHPGEGEGLATGPSRGFFLLQKSENENLPVTDFTVAPGLLGPPLHFHEHAHDIFFIIEGALELQLGTEKVEATAGAFIAVPPGVVHEFSDPGPEPARFLNLQAPAGLEQYLKELAAATPPGEPPDPTQMAQIASRYDFRSA